MSVLDEIVARVRDRVAADVREVPLWAIRELAETQALPPSFREAVVEPGTTVIAEAKRRSPSRGVLRDPFDAGALARAYEAGGARAMSVLTERDAFGGSGQDLRTARAACRLPLLRKDFVVDPYQCWEARAWGASAVLLIAAILPDEMLADLGALVHELGMDALVEVHTERETERALAAGARIVGVNNRDLATFRVDLETTGRIARELPPLVPLVAESGIGTREDVLRVESLGARAVLVGEAIVTSPHPEWKIHELRGKST